MQLLTHERNKKLITAQAVILVIKLNCARTKNGLLETSIKFKITNMHWQIIPEQYSSQYKRILYKVVRQ